MHQTMRMQFFQHWLTYARVSIFVTLVTCWPTHANTGLTWISTSQVQHVNNLINVVPFAAGRQCRHGGGAGNLQLGTKRDTSVTQPVTATLRWTHGAGLDSAQCDSAHLNSAQSSQSGVHTKVARL